MRCLLLLGAMLLRRTMPSITAATASVSAALPSSYLLSGRHLYRTYTVSTGERSKTIEFLEDSCRLSSKGAVAAANRIQINTIANAQSVTTLLERFDFTKLQIASLVAREPRVLSADPDKTLMPKLEFLRGMKVSAADVAEVITATPKALNCSLGTIETSVELLRTVLRDDRTVLVAIKRYAGLIRVDLSEVLHPKIQKLADEGVPVSTISALIRTSPKSLVCPKRPIDDTLAMIKEINVDRSKPQFVHVFRVIAESTHPIWNRRLAAYRDFGLSNEQILSAFTRFPYFMAISEENINKTTGFFKEKLGWGADKLCRNPFLMGLSLEKRIKPRCLVLENLASKSLLSGGITLYHFKMKEEMFLEKFLIKYQNDVPELAGVMVPVKRKSVWSWKT